MKKKFGIIAILLFVLMGLAVYTFASPKNKADSEMSETEIKTLNEAIAAVVFAESSQLQVDIDKAQVKINILPVGEDRSSLQERLNKVVIKEVEEDKEDETPIVTDEDDDKEQEGNKETETETEKKDTKNNNGTNTTPVVTKYTVTFNSNGGSNVSNLIVTKGNKVTKPSDPTKNGYKFNGWYYNDLAYDFDKAITANVTLLAKWEWIKIYTVKMTDVDLYSPEKKVKVYCDGLDITSQVGSIDDVSSFYYQSSENVILANKGELTKTSYTIKLSSGETVTATLSN